MKVWTAIAGQDHTHYYLWPAIEFRTLTQQQCGSLPRVCCHIKLTTPSLHKNKRIIRPPVLMFYLGNYLELNGIWWHVDIQRSKESAVFLLLKGLTVRQRRTFLCSLQPKTQLHFHPLQTGGGGTRLRQETFSSLKRPNPASWSVRTGFFQGERRPGREAAQQHPSIAEVKNAWSYISASPYACMECKGTTLPSPFHQGREREALLSYWVTSVIGVRFNL